MRQFFLHSIFLLFFSNSLLSQYSYSYDGYACSLPGVDINGSDYLGTTFDFKNCIDFINESVYFIQLGFSNFRQHGEVEWDGRRSYSSSSRLKIYLDDICIDIISYCKSRRIRDHIRIMIKRGSDVLYDRNLLISESELKDLKFGLKIDNKENRAVVTVHKCDRVGDFVKGGYTFDCHLSGIDSGIRKIFEIINLPKIYEPKISVNWNDVSARISTVYCAKQKEKAKNDSSQKNDSKKQETSSGSGIVITKNGYIVTNYHVIEEATKIEVNLNNKTYSAKIVKVDKSNDLALLKIDDDKYQNFTSIPFTIKGMNLPLGEKVFSLGFPMTQLQGTNIKLTEGSISSKTGFQDDPVCYQISVPLQPGNSGGPLFDLNGNLVGIVNAGILEANSVGYAIKNTYLLNFLDVVSELPVLNTVNQLVNKTFTQQVEELTKYCCLLNVWR